MWLRATFLFVVLFLVSMESEVNGMCSIDGCECDNQDFIEGVASLASQGKIDEAYDAVHEIGNLCCRTVAVLAIARATGAEQHFEDAVASASHIDDERIRNALMSTINSARAETSASK
jgi:hypothetical protein